MIKTEGRKRLFLKLAIGYVVVIILVKVIFKINNPYGFNDPFPIAGSLWDGLNLNIFKSIPDMRTFYIQGPVFLKNMIFTVPLGFFLGGAKVKPKIFFTIVTLIAIVIELAQLLLMIGVFDIVTVIMMILGSLMGGFLFKIFKKYTVSKMSS